jgi:hypothetical protein
MHPGAKELLRAIRQCIDGSSQPLRCCRVSRAKRQTGAPGAFAGAGQGLGAKVELIQRKLKNARRQDGEAANTPVSSRQAGSNWRSMGTKRF